jgi:hypothetical protein
VLSRTADLLLSDSPDPTHERTPWRNLFRHSDPIGGPVFAEDPGSDSDPADVLLLDPEFAKQPGDIAYPETLGHSSYPDDPEWSTILDAVIEKRTEAERHRRESAPIVDGRAEFPLPD